MQVSQPLVECNLKLGTGFPLKGHLEHEGQLTKTDQPKL